jgi:pimeloyl-ACP methyl ester carboxylesterase
MVYVCRSITTRLLPPLLIQGFGALSQTLLGLSPQIAWQPCPDSILPGIECGRIDVPLNYKPGNSIEAECNRTVSLFLGRRRPEEGTSHKFLFYNPRGPGVPAAHHELDGPYLVALAPEVWKTYDVIGLDPRGTGYSSPIKCDHHIFNERVKTLVNESKDFDALVDYNHRLGQSCANLTGKLFHHMSSIHVAKDFEVVRQALGAERFNYFGKSYGSLIGSQYLSLFPDKVGRMALEGIMDHSQSDISMAVTESVAYEQTLKLFFRWCDEVVECDFYGETPTNVIGKLLDRTDMLPLPAMNCDGRCQPTVTGEDIRYNLQRFLETFKSVDGKDWFDLRLALKEAIEGDATRLSSQLATKETSSGSTVSPYAQLVTRCQDWGRLPSSFADYRRRLLMLKPFVPWTAGASTSFYYQSRCIGWPAHVSNDQSRRDFRIDDTPPVLLAHAIYDPTFSIAWAKGLRSQIPSAVSIFREGVSHTSHDLFRSDMKEAIEHYLVTGEMPKDGSVYVS